MANEDHLFAMEVGEEEDVMDLDYDPSVQESVEEERTSGQPAERKAAGNPPLTPVSESSQQNTTEDGRREAETPEQPHKTAPTRGDSLTKSARRRLRKEKLEQAIREGLRPAPEPKDKSAKPRPPATSTWHQEANRSNVEADDPMPDNFTSEVERNCWNCGGKDHKYSDCPLPLGKFCRGCGRKGKTLATCEWCRKRWKARGKYVPTLGRNVPDAQRREYYRQRHQSARRPDDQPPTPRQADLRDHLRQVQQQRRNSSRSEEHDRRRKPDRRDESRERR